MSESTQSTKTRKRVTRTDFMVAWEEVAAGLNNGSLTGTGVRLVADRLGLKEGSVSQRASKYRSKDKIPLSPMPRSFDRDAARKELEEIKARLAGTADAEDTDTENEGDSEDS